jgi:hypothetical protein
MDFHQGSEESDESLLDQIHGLETNSIARTNGMMFIGNLLYFTDPL